MELRHFRVVTVLAEELHFGRAAHRLNTSQPVVSKTLRDIEEEIGTKLFERSTRKVTLTRAGSAFLASAAETLRHAARAVPAARSSATGGLERLRLGLTIGAAQPAVGQLIARVRAENPVADIQIVAVNEASLGRSLATGALDAAIAWDRSVPAGLETQHFASVPMSVLVPQGHTLAGRGQVSMKDLDGLTVILPARDEQPVLFDTYRRYCVDQGVHLEHPVDVATTADMLAMISGGVGVGHAPIPEGLHYPGIVCLRQDPPFDLEFVLVWAHRSRATEALVLAHQGQNAPAPLSGA